MPNVNLILFFIVVYASNCVQETQAITGECVSFKNNANQEKFQLVYDWNYVNFSWTNPEIYKQAVASKLYIPENNAIVGVKFHNERFYFALPKAKQGAPITLAWVKQYPDFNIHGHNPLLTPFPSWKMNTDSDCKSLQNVQSMEIDRKGVMWVLDGRRIDHHETSTKCPPKIVLLDLNSNGKMIKSYTVPNDICKHDSCFLNDLVLDEFDGGFAYITDTSSDPGLIVYSRKHNKAWKARDKTMFAQDEAMNFTVHGYIHPHATPIDGIAMSAPNSLDDPNRTVYYTALTGLNIYAVNSSVLRNEKLATSQNFKNYIKDMGKKVGPSDGLMMDSEGDLYYGVLTQDAISKWDSKQDISTASTVDQNTDMIIWPDSFGYDPFGNLYLVSNNIGYFLSEDISKENINFRLLKLYTGTCSYQY